MEHINLFTVPKGKIYNTAEDCKELIENLNKHEKLEILELSGASFGLDACKLISDNLHKHPSITVVNFADMFTGKKSDEIPFAVKALMDALKGKKITSIDWSDNAFGPNGVRGFIDFMVGNTTVTSLNINNTGLGPEGGRLVASGLQGCTIEQYDAKTQTRGSQHCKLEVLKAGRGRLEDQGVIALSAALKNMKTLKVLYLPQSGITPKGMIVLADALQHNLDLEELNLYDNNIGKKGAPEMTKALGNLKKLKKLNFGDCMIGNKGITLMAQHLKTLTSLEELDLCYSGANDDTANIIVEIIEKNPKLSKLELNGNRFSSEGFKLINKALKKIEKPDILGTLSENESEGSESEEDKESDDGNESKNSDDELVKAVDKMKI